MPTKDSTPALEQWKRLYDLMGSLKELAPWEYMYEHNLFGIRFPGSNTLGFVSVMGNLGEHLAAAVYIGKKGLDGFMTMQRIGYGLTADIVLQIPQLQASLEDREMITGEDRKIIKQLDLKFRGRNAWPQFRSYRPGCFPWYPERDEARMLIDTLEQLMDVAPRFKNDPSLLGTSDPHREFLVRTFENGKWMDRYQKIIFPPDPPIQVKMNMDALNHLKGMSRQDATIEVDLSMMDQAVKDKEFDRPYYPFLLLAAEKQSRMILGFDMLTPLPSFDEMWGDVPAALTEILANFLLPKEIHTKNPTLALLLSPLEKELGAKVRLVPRLRAIEFVQREVREFTFG